MLVVFFNFKEPVTRIFEVITVPPTQTDNITAYLLSKAQNKFEFACMF